MTHDSARLSALVDGELDHDTRDRVLAHLAGCDECRAIVDAERRVRGLVGSLRDATPPPPDQLVSGLLDVETMRALEQADPTSLTGGASRLGESAFSKSIAMSSMSSRRRLRRQVVLGVAGAAGAFGVTAALAFAVGGEPGPSPQVNVTPPVQQFDLRHAGSTSGRPFWEPGAINDLVDRSPQWGSGR